MLENQDDNLGYKKEEKRVINYTQLADAKYIQQMRSTFGKKYTLKECLHDIEKLEAAANEKEKELYSNI